MIRPLTIATFLMASGSGLYLYQSKHEAQVLDRTIEKTLRETATYREQSRLLAAEWTMLNDPESLRRFSDAHLTLKTITPSQFTSLADLDSRLPPVPMPVSAPADGVAEEAGEPVAAVMPPPPPAVDVPPAMVTDDTVRVAARPVPPSPTAAAHPAERKVVVSRSSVTDAAYRPAATDPGPPSRVAANVESGPAGPHSADPRSGDRHISPPAETHVTEPRAGDTHTAAALPQSRPMVVAAASRPVTAGPTVASPAATTPVPAGTTAAPGAPQGPVQAPRGGSLLGMARGSAASPLPRPTPINASQSYNAN
jgi:hypothetical protein